MIDETIEALRKAERPVIITGGGILWSDASSELQEFVEKPQIPFYTTPQGRGVIPEDHTLSFMTVRSAAFREADLIMIIGTRMNYIIEADYGRCQRANRFSVAWSHSLKT